MWSLEKVNLWAAVHCEERIFVLLVQKKKKSSLESDRFVFSDLKTTNLTLSGDTEVNASTRKSDFMGSSNPKGIQRKP